MAKSINVTVAVAVILFCSHTTSVFCNDGLFGFTYQKSNKITEVGENWDSTDNVGNLRNERSVHRVSKRQVNYDIPDDSLQQYIVDYHNRLRRQEGASDMEYMVSISIGYCLQFTGEIIPLKFRNLLESFSG